MKVWHIAGIGTICIAAHFIRWSDQSLMGNIRTIFQCPSRTILYIVYPAKRNSIEVNHVPSDMWQRGFLTKKESATWYPVLQRQCLDSNASILIDNLMACGVNGMEINRIFQSLTEEIYLRFQHLLIHFRGIYCQRCCSSK